jgi:peroxiredoxin
MANKLTGSYDAVAQISRRQLNGLVASLHQNGASEQPLRLGHNGVIRVGDPKRTAPELHRLRFRNWIRNFQLAGVSLNLDEVRARLAANAPPGAATMIEEEFSKLKKGRPAKQPAGQPSKEPRGRVKLQLSSPTITLADGATSEATLLTDVRAHYDPDSGAGQIAAADHPLHGEVRAAFELSVHSGASGRKLSVRPSSKDSKIQFTAAAGTGLTTAEVSRISGEVRDIVREKFTPQPVDLPPEFPFSEFKVIGSGANQVIALPIQVSDSPLPAGRIQTLDNNFADSSGFAFAASKEYVAGLLDPLFDKVKKAVRDFKKEITIGVTILGVRLQQTIRFSLQLRSGPKLEWEAGNIKLSAHLKLVVKPGPDLSFRFSQKLKLALDAATQKVTLQADGNPSVNTSLPFNVLHDAFENAIKSARDNALADGVNDAVSAIFATARQKLIGGLKVFDESATATFTTVKITTDGLIVRGDIGSGPRQAPVVQFAEIEGGRAFSALPTWIPGGKIDRYIWSWTGHGGKKPAKLFSASHRSATETHRFIFPKPAGMDPLGSVTLRIEGTQTGADGVAVPVTAESTPQLRDAFGTIFESPAWWEPLTTPVWLEETKPGARLKDLIAGHITLQSDEPGDRKLTHNTLVYFPDWRADRPLEPVARAMAAMRRRKVSLVLNVVLPEDALDMRRSDLEAKLDPVSGRFAGCLMVTMDQAGGWSRAFAVDRRPSAHIVDARRQFAWNAQGDIAPAAMAAALDRHVLPAFAPRAHVLRPKVSGCGCGCHGAPDIVFEDDKGERFALHRMRGRDIILNFFQSWSAPCIRELQRLQALQKAVQKKQPKGGGPSIVAFHGGNDEKAIADLRKRHRLTFTLVQDRNQAIARQYGITCWPTTIAVNPDGSIGRMQLGAVQDAKPARRPAKSSSARTAKT